MLDHLGEVLGVGRLSEARLPPHAVAHWPVGWDGDKLHLRKPFPDVRSGEVVAHQVDEDGGGVSWLSHRRRVCHGVWWVPGSRRGRRAVPAAGIPVSPGCQAVGSASPFPDQDLLGHGGHVDPAGGEHLAHSQPACAGQAV